MNELPAGNPGPRQGNVWTALLFWAGVVALAVVLKWFVLPRLGVPT